MKKMISLLLVLAMTLTMTACGTGEKATESAPAASSNPSALVNVPPPGSH